MTTAEAYAKALFALIEENPRKGATYLHNLVGVLRKWGHGPLLPRVFREYRTLELRKERAAAAGKVTKEEERTRVLLELYRKLIA